MDIQPETLKVIYEVREKHEFLTFLILEDDIVFGIVHNETPKVIMLYQFDGIRDAVLQEEFLRYGDEWWWGSNQKIPINAFIGEPFDKFSNILRGWPKKSVKKIIGPTFNLAELYLKRVKKKRVEILNTSRPA